MNMFEYSALQARLLKSVICVLFLCCGHVWSRDSDVTCHGGRGEGDKWFDGCRWCVCRSDGPKCSPAKCSHHVASIPPCDNLGSRWWDGCYHCKCRIDGIECTADESCVMGMLKEPDNFLKTGKCMEPQDDRCVCGIDGVPSCSADVIDRNQFCSTKIELDASSPNKTRLVETGTIYYEHHSNSNKRQISNGCLTKSRTRKSIRRSDISSILSSDHHRHRQEKSHSPSERRERFKSFRELLNAEKLQRHTHGRKSRIHHSKRDPSEGEVEEHENTFPAPVYSHHDYQDDGTNVQAPPSLLKSSDNRCRFGVRWYGGGLRCYCDAVGSITCGDPAFVAARIDGFRFERASCVKGENLDEEGSCRECECEMSGMVKCQRSSKCPLPYLIQPVSVESRDERIGGDLMSQSRKRGHDDKSLLLPDGGKTIKTDDLIKATDTDHNIGAERKRDNLKLPSTTAVSKRKNPDLKEFEKSDEVIDRSRVRSNSRFRNHHHLRQNFRRRPDQRQGDKRTTMVIIRECKPHSRWLDGCKRCHCDTRGKKYCDESQCLKAMMVTRKPPSHHRPRPYVDGKRISRPMQRPPSLSMMRDTPVHHNHHHRQRNLCGRFKVHQVYWSECNLCLCTPKGPKCTAKNCG